jgi:hypothetical protein
VLLVIIQIRENDAVLKCTVQFVLIIMQVFAKPCEKHVLVARARYVSVCTVLLASKVKNF